MSNFFHPGHCPKRAGVLQKSIGEGVQMRDNNEKGNRANQILAAIAFIIFIVMYYLTRLGYL